MSSERKGGLYFENATSRDIGKSVAKSANKDHPSGDYSPKEEVRKKSLSSYKDSEAKYKETKKKKTLKKIVEVKQIAYKKEEFEVYLNTIRVNKDSIVDIELGGSGYTEEAIQRLAEELKECPRIKVCFTLQD